MRSFPIFYIAFLICMVGIDIIVVMSGSSSDVSHGNAARFEMVSFTVMATMLLLTGVSTLFWIGGLVHLLCNRSLEGTERIVWLLVVILLNALGAVLYFFIAPLPPPRRALSAA
ncbi:MAG: hypothetical protein BGO12_16405 [Verrucomicrobia bacterium 61-8]|nr:PLDc N-terminal domain-containing protein [Verrucomicrobiota bacterium]OJV16137.1 MAG: hypothetical protein BGO12_16405 [Verrucomicrobia bacterium 61-8]